MERIKSGQPSVAGRGTKARDEAGPARVRIARLRDVDTSSRAVEYSAFADQIYRDLDPQGPLERLAAEHVAFSAWVLREALAKQVARRLPAPIVLEGEVLKTRIRASELDRASRSLGEALEIFEKARGRIRLELEAVGEVEVQVDFLSVECPIVPETDPIGPEDPDEDEDEVPSWRDRLIFDFEVSEISPVVKGTWITVGHVVSLIVDGWSWADILRSHPELGEDDIRTCVAYAMAEENSPA